MVALLGPTNTGKTHRAVTRMLEHSSGMLGLPLRLLAREIYDRLTRELGEQAVALVTGEEKRIGRRTRYWICTVEAMPLTREVDFMAIDEVQLAAHPERGHVFTDRLLHARGKLETWFLGADTARPILRDIVPTANFESLPRLSVLKGRGQSRLKELPARSAVVAFSVPEVYRLADSLRHRRGGAAVVLGALSPRARNAQVALYEAREVDYLVATDAIGMGLNLGIRHVAFASLHKFDGKEQRPLEPAELGQVAGRAGRYTENGSFGTLAPVPALPPGLERNIEEHRFSRLQKLSWRNSDLSMSSVRELLASLARKPPAAHFVLASDTPDRLALERLAEDAEVKRRARGQSGVELLWETCQIPDYRRWFPEYHAELIKQVFLQLSGPEAAVAEDWLWRAIKPLDDVRGDLDALTQRIAEVRTLSYISNRDGWLQDSEHWVQRTRELEDRLSDALHEQLMRRFIARRRQGLEIAALSDTAATDAVDQQRASARGPFGALEDLRAKLLAPLGPEPGSDRWLEELLAAPQTRFRLDENAQILDGDLCLGRLARGASLLRPEIKLSPSGLSAGQQLQLSRKLLAWSRDMVQELIGALESVSSGAWSPAARGLAYQLAQSLGSLPARAVQAQRALLTASDIAAFERLGVRLGREAVYLVSSFEPPQAPLRLALCRAFMPALLEKLPPLLRSASFPVPRGLDERELAPLGFIVLGPRAIRCDIADRLAGLLRRRARRGPFRLPASAALVVGGNMQDLEVVAIALGYRRDTGGRFRGGRRRSKSRAKPQTSELTEPGSTARSTRPR